MIGQFIIVLYVAILLALSIYGLLGLFTLALYWRHRQVTSTTPVVSSEALPDVTIQLPIYNEKFVVERLVASAASQDYPRERLQIQIVDDSDDETTSLAGKLAKRYRQQGFDIALVRRENRAGYKAGALEAASATASGEFIAIFDADFSPDPGFLRAVIPHFQSRDNLGMIQARWGHINDDQSPLTAVQAIALDKHFVMEQTVRHRANLFPKFNGAAGVWRRSCIDDAGGWQADTVCEDLCLSTRAALRGWEFQFLPEVVAPAELPTTISAYKNQQARWAKGSLQCLIKFSGEIIHSRHHSPVARLYALLAMSAYITHPLILLLLLLQLPLLLSGLELPSWLVLLGMAGIGQPLLFIAGQQILYKDWRRRLRHLPTLLLVAIGLAPSNSRALLQILSSGRHPFIRTPKVGDAPSPSLTHYRLPPDWSSLAEFALAAYAAVGLLLALSFGQYGPLLFLTTCLFGFAYVFWLGWRERQLHS